MSSSGITQWLQDNAVPLVVFIIGLGLLMSARKGESSKVILVAALSIIGFAVIAIALDATLGINIGRWLLDLANIRGSGTPAPGGGGAPTTAPAPTPGG